MYKKDCLLLSSNESSSKSSASIFPEALLSNLTKAAASAASLTSSRLGLAFFFESSF
jgi:hypothetical protein